MKVKNDEVVLGRRDTRIGNFVFTDLDDAVSLQDINGTLRMRVNLRSLGGMLLKIALNEGDSEGYLRAWAATMYNVCLCPADEKFLLDLNDVCQRCYERHQDLYSVRDVTDEEDAKIIEEERENREALDEINEDIKKSEAAKDE